MSTTLSTPQGNTLGTKGRTLLGRLLLGLLLALAGFFLTLSATHAQEAKDLAEDPVVEKRLMAIAAELRCLVCQNESLAASNADLAVDLRREIRTLIKADRSDQQILDFLVVRYGDFVRYRPPFKPLTWALWLGPFLLLIVGATVLVRRTRRQPDTPTGSGPHDLVRPTLTPEQIAKANQLLQASPQGANHASPAPDQPNSNTLPKGTAPAGQQPPPT